MKNHGCICRYNLGFLSTKIVGTWGPHLAGDYEQLMVFDLHGIHKISLSS